MGSENSCSMVSLPACLHCNTVCYGVVSEWLLYVTFMPFEKKVFAFRAYVSLVGIYFEMNDFFNKCIFDSGFLRLRSVRFWQINYILYEQFWGWKMIKLCHFIAHAGLECQIFHIGVLMSYLDIHSSCNILHYQDSSYMTIAHSCSNGKGARYCSWYGDMAMGWPAEK